MYPYECARTEILITEQTIAVGSKEYDDCKIIACLHLLRKNVSYFILYNVLPLVAMYSCIYIFSTALSMSTLSIDTAQSINTLMLITLPYTLK